MVALTYLKFFPTDWHSRCWFYCLLLSFFSSVLSINVQRVEFTELPRSACCRWSWWSPSPRTAHKTCLAAGMLQWGKGEGVCCGEGYPVARGCFRYLPWVLPCGLLAACAPSPSLSLSLVFMPMNISFNWNAFITGKCCPFPTPCPEAYIRPLLAL